MRLLLASLSKIIRDGFLLSTKFLGVTPEFSYLFLLLAILTDFFQIKIR